MTEAERSVARGAAAPFTNGHVAPPTALTVAEPTAHTRAQTRVQAEDETTVLPRGAAVAGRSPACSSGSPPPAPRSRLSATPAPRGADKTRAPLFEDEVRDVAQDFAQAYQDEDGTALRRLLTPGVRAVADRGRARARACGAEDESKLPPAGDRGLLARRPGDPGGRAGRASGSYTVDRKDKQPIEGRIVLGMVRDRGSRGSA